MFERSLAQMQRLLVLSLTLTPVLNDSAESSALWHV